MPQSFHSFLKSIASVPVSILASIAAWTAINDVKISERSVLKRRHWHASFWRVPGNFALRFRKAPVRVLSTGQWTQRERELAGATAMNGTVEMPKLQGIPLSQFLDSEQPCERKLKAIIAALRSLYDFHQTHQQSHGDASVTNVMILAESSGEISATWFDFDVAHTGHSLAANRTDDLRALLATSKSKLNRQNMFEANLAALREAYPDEYAMDGATEMLDSQIIDLFHLAQIIRARQN